MPEHILNGLGAGHCVSGNPGMLEALRRFDWAGTSAGPIDLWAEPLKHAARLVMLSPAAMAILLGKEGLVVYNDTMRDLFGAHYEGSLGKPITTIFPEAAAFCREAIDQCFTGVGSRFRDEPLRVLRDGSWCTGWFHLAFTPVCDVDGHVSGAFLVVSETTARVQALRDLRRSQERIEIALDAGGIVGIWDLDLSAGRLTCDERLASLYGKNAQEGCDGVEIETVIKQVHPEDRGKVREALGEAVRTGSDYVCRHRMTVAGDTRWYLHAGKAMRDEQGAIAKLCGVAIDLTNQTRAENALVESEGRLRAVVEFVPQIVWSTDPQGQHDYFNSRWYEFTGIDTGRLEPAAWERLVHPEDWARVSEHWGHSLATGAPYDIEYRFLHHTGRHRWLRVMALPVLDPNGIITRWYGTATDIEDGKTLELERELVTHELDHRIRNLFALVNGLVALCGREDPGFRSFADTLQRRLGALHKAHELIRRRDPSNMAAMSLGSLVRNILSPYEVDQRILIQGEDVSVGDHLVTPLALVFHELATNAAKYGALSRDEGLVTVQFQAANGRLELDWIEEGTGGGEVIQKEQGFGSKLLDVTIERQLKGEFSRKITPFGLRFEMHIPW